MNKEEFRPGTKFRIWSRSSEVFEFANESTMTDGFLNVLTTKTWDKEAVAFYDLVAEDITFYNAKRFMGGYHLVECKISLAQITVVDDVNNIIP